MLTRDNIFRQNKAVNLKYNHHYYCFIRARGCSQVRSLLIINENMQGYILLFSKHLIKTHHRIDPDR
jgi:nitrous oxidase accessory protein NosD